MNMEFYVKEFHQNNPEIVRLCCPICGEYGVLENLGVHDLWISNERKNFGQRRCPNPDCHSHLFVVYDQDGIYISYPPETIPFESENIPEKIVDIFEEALICEANQCYMASVIMIRRTLEELCKDQKAEGKTLKDRLIALADKIVIPQSLKDGLQELRLLGNDAAHAELKNFVKIGEDELEVSVKFTIKILEATYQYKDLLDDLKRLKANK